MDWGVVGSAFIFGLTASISCLGLCIPILVPYIMERDKTSKEGLFTSIFFSMGRFMIYMSMGLAVFMIGSQLTGNSPEIVLRIAVLLLGIVIISYGAWIVFRVSKPKWCPAKVSQNFRPAFSVILGLLIGSFFCPLLWFTLVQATLTRDFPTLVMSVAVFWVGSSGTILAAGFVSGEVGGRWRKKIGLERIRDICGMALILVGIFYLINPFIL
jgi:sulfite exporter TauE/SafE